MKIITDRNQGFSWQHRGGLHAKGCLFDGEDAFYQGEGLLDYFAGVNGAEAFEARVRGANGGFAVILDTGAEVFAAVDRVRSIPLFFARHGGSLILGDDMCALQSELGGMELDPVAREEFLRVGFTVGPGTLDARIGQIEAGDMVIYNTATGQFLTRTYFCHAHGLFTNAPEEVLIEELDLVTTRWARRLIRSAEGRTLVVPLSGGYDSRSIVCALKREGCAQVVCYSYGAPRCFEHQTARQVAQRLGYPIYVVEYDRRRWETVIGSSEFPAFCNFLFQQSAIPCIQELPACEELARAGVIPADAIIVPGYCGDLLGGSRIPSEVREFRDVSAHSDRIENHLFRQLFHHLSAPPTPEMRQVMVSRIRAYTSQFPSGDSESFCSVSDDWFTRHRVAKFVVNTVRTHEWFGHEWRLPLWDNELTEWWYRIPLKHRINSRLYHRYLFKCLFEPMGVGFRKPSPRVQLDSAARRYLPAAIIPLVRGLYTRTISRLRPQPMDVGAFDDASLLLLRQCGSGQTPSDFANINGVIAAWCDAFLIDDHHPSVP